MRRAPGFLAAIVILASCSEGVAPFAPHDGTIKVVTATSGGDPDDDGYDVVIDGSRHVSLGADGVAYVDSMSAGPHEVALQGIANNCDPAPSTSTTVASDAVVTVEFKVTCEATGVEINTQTTGPDYGPYQITVGNRIGSVAANGTIEVTRLAPGTQTFSLVNLSSFCRLVGDQSAFFNVINRKIAHVTISVSCRASDKALAFVLDYDAGGVVVVSRIDGTLQEKLANGRAPAWSPDGGKIAYSNAGCTSTFYNYYDYKVTCSGGLLTLNPNNGLSTPIPFGENGTDPSWSPDGKSIAFSKQDMVSFDHSRLYVLKLDGSSLAFEIPAPVRDATRPAWAPDGKRIAFECLFDADTPGTTYREICLINSDGTGFKRLTNDQALDQRPAWSPDGNQIAFSILKYTGDEQFHQFTVSLMSPEGTNVVRIGPGGSPAWSPDGSRLVFDAADGLFMSNRDGSNLVRITTGSHRFAAWRPLTDSSSAGPWDY